MTFWDWFIRPFAEIAAGVVIFGAIILVWLLWEAAMLVRALIRGKA